MVVVVSGLTLSLAAGAKSAELVTGDYQFINPGRLVLAAKASAAAATGIRATLAVNGTPIINDLPVMFAGTTGTLSINDNIVANQMVGAGRVSLTFRNDSAGTLTVDYSLQWIPGRS